MPTTLVVCESPWTDDKGRFARWSMRPFVEGICELNGVRLIYRTFSTRSELTTLLGGEAFDNTRQRILVYIAAHGWGGRIALGRNGGAANLATVAQWLRKGVEGVWLGCCDLGSSDSLEEFLKYGGAVWAGGYECSVDWAPSALVDTAVLQELITTAPIRRRDGVLRVFARALTGFNPAWVIGVDSREVGIRLGRAIRIVARDRTQGARAEDISHKLRDRLKWNGKG